MAFLARSHLAQHVIADGLREKPALGRDANGDEPGRGAGNHQRHAPKRTKGAKPGRAAIHHQQSDAGQQGHHGRDGALQQHASAKRQPKAQGLLCGELRRRKIGAPHQQHRRRDAGEQSRIGLGDMGFHHQHHAGCQHGRRQKCRASPNQGSAQITSGQYREQRADQ
jgi:hypothetical protein